MRREGGEEGVVALPRGLQREQTGNHFLASHSRADRQASPCQRGVRLWPTQGLAPPGQCCVAWRVLWFPRMLPQPEAVGRKGPAGQAVGEQSALTKGWFLHRSRGSSRL